ncbi:2871_t:CDS:10 [Entrophospora sp. SA101]|nr:2871_t:CDS:10 [Entrophospora sp. SA101]
MSGLSTSLEDSNLITLALSLRQTLEPSTRAYAEKQLEVEEQRPNFSISLLQLVTNDTLEITVRTAAALLFKNYVKRKWNWEEESKIQPEIRKTIKDTIIDILIAVPTTLQTQLIESITIIADSDFPDDWENLLPKLIHNFSQDDFVRNNAILLTAHSIFKKWKHQFKSDPLYKEINYVLDIFCEPFFQLLQATDAYIEQNNNNKENLQLFSNTLLLLLKVFYDLNCQDLPPFFEDNWEACMNLFHKYITYQNPLLETQSEEEAGTLEKIKSSVCEIIILYTNKYEEISTMLPQFVNTIWNFLTTIGLEPKYDIELFEFDPIEYIRRDLEGSDSDTRRRAATDFVRSLMSQYLHNITRVIGVYIAEFLKRYNENQKNWKDKDVAIYLLTSIATPGTTTKVSYTIQLSVELNEALLFAKEIIRLFKLNYKYGLTVVNDLVDVVEWFSANVLPDLQTVVDSGEPVLKVDAIKYIYTFRNQMNKSQLTSVFPLLVKHVSSSNYVVHTYAAITIDKMLTMRKDNAMLFSRADIKPYTQELLISLFRLIESGTTPQTLAENDYLMKAVMRVIFTSREDILPYVGDIMSHLIAILGQISKNPSNPRFNYYVFESIGALIRFNCQGNTELRKNFEDTLSGNIPGLVKLLQTYLYRYSNIIISNGQLEPILGIFHKLIANKKRDKYGLDLLSSVIRNVPTAALNQYIGPILTLLLSRFQSSKTDSYTMGFVYFVCYFLAVDKEGMNPDYVIQAFDSLQNQLFIQVLNAFIIPHLQKVQGYMERKICAVGMTRLITQKDMQFQTSYSKLATTNKPKDDPTESIKDPKIFLAQSIKNLNDLHPEMISETIQKRIPPEYTHYLFQYMTY